MQRHIIGKHSKNKELLPKDNATVTTRVSLFSSPFLLGFDQFERTLDRVAKGSDSYPPYNIEQTGEAHLRITLAVAGFAQEDLSVQVEDNQLVIRGRQREDERERLFLHRGIAARQFQKIFVLAEGIEIVSAALDNGLLHIDLARPLVAPKVRNVPINKGKVNTAQTIPFGQNEK